MILGDPFCSSSILLFVYSIRASRRRRLTYLRGDNDYVTGVAASYIFAANAVNDVLNEKKPR